jgi:hypothetical protein
MKKVGLLQALLRNILQNPDHVLVTSVETGTVESQRTAKGRGRERNALLVRSRNIPRNVDDLLVLWKELIEVVDALLKLGKKFGLARGAFFLLFERAARQWSGEG